MCRKRSHVYYIIETEIFILMIFILYSVYLENIDIKYINIISSLNAAAFLTATRPIKFLM